MGRLIWLWLFRHGSEIFFNILEILTFLSNIRILTVNFHILTRSIHILTIVIFIIIQILLKPCVQYSIFCYTTANCMIDEHTESMHRITRDRDLENLLLLNISKYFNTVDLQNQCCNESSTGRVTSRVTQRSKSRSRVISLSDSRDKSMGLHSFKSVESILHLRQRAGVENSWT